MNTGSFLGHSLVRSRGLDTQERRLRAAILFLMGSSNALEVMEKLRKQDGGAHNLPPAMPLLLHVQASGQEDLKTLLITCESAPRPRVGMLSKRG